MIEKVWIEFGKFLVAYGTLNLLGFGLRFFTHRIRAFILAWHKRNDKP
jgi:hypothetical protein